VLAAYSKEDFAEMMDLYRIQDTDGVKQMVSEGKVVGLRKGALVYLEDVDVRDGIVKVRPGREYHNRLDSKPIPELLNALFTCSKCFCFAWNRLHDFTPITNS